MAHEEHHHSHDRGPVAVAVITPSGIYPSPDDYRRAYESEAVGKVLTATAEKLGIRDTHDWDVYVENKPIDAAKTFAENGLSCIVEIEWHKREGGGGA